MTVLATLQTFTIEDVGQQSLSVNQVMMAPMGYTVTTQPASTVASLAT